MNGIEILKKEKKNHKMTNTKWKRVKGWVISYSNSYKKKVIKLLN